MAITWRWVEAAGGQGPARLPHGPTPPGVRDEPGHGLGQGGPVVDGHEEPGPLVLDHLAAAAHVGGHHRQAHGRRLHGRPREALAVRGQHVEVHGRVAPRHVLAAAREAHAVPDGVGPGVGVDGVALGVVGRPDDHHDRRRGEGPEPLGGVEHRSVALLPHEAAHHAHDHVVVAHTQLGPHRGPLVGPPVGIEPGQVHAVAQEAEAPAGHPQPGQGLEVLGVLHQLDVGAGGGQPLEPVDHGPLDEAVVGGGEQAVLGVHHHGHAHGAAGDPPQHPGLGVVGVHDVGSQPPQDRGQLAHGGDVAIEGHGPGGVAQRDDRDARGGEVLGVPAGAGQADDLVAGGGEALELGPQQPVEAHVGRGHVHDPGTAAPRQQRRRRRRVAHVAAPR